MPSEYSSGESVHRGRITKAGSVESAWCYQHRPNLGLTLRRRQQHTGPATVARSWTAQQRLCARYGRLAARKTSRNVVTRGHRPGTGRVPVGRDDRRLTARAPKLS